MTPFAALRASLVLPLGLSLVLLGPYGATNALATPRRSLSAQQETGQDAPGKALYLEYCKTCHGVLGVPSKLMVKRFEKIPNLTEAGFLSARSDDSLVVVMKKGIGGNMKSFADKLSSEEMRAVAMYIRTLGHAH